MLSRVLFGIWGLVLVISPERGIGDCDVTHANVSITTQVEIDTPLIGEEGKIMNYEC